MNQSPIKYLLIRVEIWQNLNFAQMNQDYTYGNSLFSSIQSISSNLQMIDLDNFSESYYIQLITDLLDETELFLVVFEVKEVGKIQNLMRLLEKILVQSSKAQIILNGEHPILEKMLKPLGESKIFRNLGTEKQEEILQTWTKNLN